MICQEKRINESPESISVGPVWLPPVQSHRVSWLSVQMSSIPAENLIRRRLNLTIEWILYLTSTQLETRPPARTLPGSRIASLNRWSKSPSSSKELLSFFGLLEPKVFLTEPESIAAERRLAFFFFDLVSPFKIIFLEIFFPLILAKSGGGPFLPFFLDACLRDLLLAAILGRLGSPPMSAVRGLLSLGQGSTASGSSSGGRKI